MYLFVIMYCLLRCSIRRTFSNAIHCIIAFIATANLPRRAFKIRPNLVYTVKLWGWPYWHIHMHICAYIHIYTPNIIQSLTTFSLGSRIDREYIWRQQSVKWTGTRQGGGRKPLSRSYTFITLVWMDYIGKNLIRGQQPPSQTAWPIMVQFEDGAIFWQNSSIASL